MVRVRTRGALAHAFLSVAVLASALLVGSAALAQEAGNGEGGGKMFYSVTHTPSASSCTEVTSFSGSSAGPDGNYSGTYSATDPAKGITISYSGPLSVTLEALETYYSSPSGTFSDSMCLVPHPVLVRSTVAGASGAVTVSCEYSGNFTHRRPKGITHSDSFETLAQLSGSCLLTDTAPEPDASILINAAEIRNGDLVKCSGPPGTKSCHSTERYRAALADED